MYGTWAFHVSVPGVCTRNADLHVGKENVVLDRIIGEIEWFLSLPRRDAGSESEIEERRFLRELLEQLRAQRDLAGAVR